MSQTGSIDPRAKRTRSALQCAFKELLQIKSYPKISVTDITARAGVARHTFYNHYETKQDLLFNIVDSILREFFSGLERWNLISSDPEQELYMQRTFFLAWKDNAEIIDLLGTGELELVIIERLKAFFTLFYYERVSLEMPEVNLALAKYVISFNAYSLLGMLKTWFESGLKHDPDDLSGLFIELAGSRNRRIAVKKYAEVFKE